MNKLDNTFLSAGDMFLYELDLRQPGFTCSAFGPFTKHPERIKKFKETSNLKHIYKNELDKACCAHDAAYSDSKDLAKKTTADKILKDRAYEIAINSKCNGYKRRLATMVHKFFDKKTGLVAITTSKAGVSGNEEFA